MQLRQPLSADAVPLDALSHMADSSIAATGLPILETDVYARKSAEAANNYAVTSLVLTMPISMEGAILRSQESPIELLNRAAFVHKHFIQSSHTSGPNYHNVSLTVNYKAQKEEEDSILEWLLAHTDCFAGVSMFPDMGSDNEEVEGEAEVEGEGEDEEEKERKKKKTTTKRRKTPRYPQMPFEEIDEETYEQWLAAWNSLGLMAREQMLRDLLRDSSSASHTTTAAAVDIAAAATAAAGTSEEKERKMGEEEDAVAKAARMEQKRRQASEQVEREAEEEEKRRILEFLTSDRFTATSPNPPIPGVQTPLAKHMLSPSPSPASSSSCSAALSLSSSSPTSTPMKGRSPPLSPPTLSPSLSSSPPVHASVEDSFRVIRMGLSKVLWDPKAKDTRKQTLACAGGNCEYV